MKPVRLVDKKYLKREALYTNILILLNISTAFLSLITFILPLEEDVEFFFVLRLFDMYFLEQKQFVEWCLRLAYVPFTLAMLSPAYLFVYISTIFKFQLYILVNNIKAMKKQSKTQHYYDTRRKLIYCFQRQQLLYL